MFSSKSVTKLEDLMVLCSELQRAHGDRRLGRLGGPVHGGGAGRGGGGVAVRAAPGRPQLRPRLPQDRDGRAGGGSRHRRRSYRYILFAFSLWFFSTDYAKWNKRWRTVSGVWIGAHKNTYLVCLGHIVIVLLYVILELCVEEILQIS